MAQKSHMATHHNFCNNGSVIVYSHVTEFPSFITLCIFNLPYWDILMPLWSWHLRQTDRPRPAHPRLDSDWDLIRREETARSQVWGVSHPRTDP